MTGASVPVLMNPAKTVKYKGVACVHGRTREESCYWILLASKRYRKLLVRIKERKKNKERRKKKREREGTPREQKEYMVGEGLLCPMPFKGFEKWK